jgi:endonuclease/exonuclease/phosphatase family metal-dependent hydrolase
MTLTVLAYNIREGGSDRITVIAEIIRAQQPDAVALAEATDRATVEALATILHMPLTFGEAPNGFHLAWLCRLPIRRWQNHHGLGLAKTLLEIEIDWASTTVSLFATHLASRHDTTRPVDEVPAILTALRSLGDRPHLLAGDLNALRPDDPVGNPPPGRVRRGDAAGAPRRAIARLIEAGYVDSYRTVHPQTPGYTYPSDAPWLRLDYIFASPAMAQCLVACDLVTGEAPTRASDHLPIWAAFRDPPCPPGSSAAS